MRLIFISILSILFFITSFAQKQLVMVKGNKVVARISEGDFLRFKRKGDDHFTRGYIEGIHQDHFRIGEDTTFLYDVAAVDLRGHSSSGFRIARSGVTLMVAGVILLLTDAHNSGNIDSGVVVVSSAFIGTGIFMQFVNNDIFRIGRKKRIITMG